ncbi:hypothetical protein AAG738_10995 [Staphylococcus saprophyticus]
MLPVNAIPPKIPIAAKIKIAAIIGRSLPSKPPFFLLLSSESWLLSPLLPFPPLPPLPLPPLPVLDLECEAAAAPVPAAAAPPATAAPFS